MFNRPILICAGICRSAYLHCKVQEVSGSARGKGNCFILPQMQHYSPNWIGLLGSGPLQVVDHIQAARDCPRGRMWHKLPTSRTGNTFCPSSLRLPCVGQTWLTHTYPPPVSMVAQGGQHILPSEWHKSVLQHFCYTPSPLQECALNDIHQLIYIVCIVWWLLSIVLESNHSYVEMWGI